MPVVVRRLGRADFGETQRANASSAGFASLYPAYPEFHEQTVENGLLVRLDDAAWTPARKVH
ncbi:hypothetical protein D3879_26095 [Pseudomonas cavernicola]|uniref:Uncharacterized protein n=1 Tax=Pseudomonas cavernicola TaxID=2320866 RepID=A0A418XA67_9PSED|nr:hypothetical protein D3879_26095 [Pseudomonas cavernicola]